VSRAKDYAHEGVSGQLCLRTFVYLDPEGAVMQWADETETIIHLGEWELHLTASEGSGPDGEQADNELAIALANELVSRLHRPPN